MSEIIPGSNDDSLVSVAKPPEELCRPAFLASIEGRPIVLSHPTRFVSSNDWSTVARGHAQNIRCQKNADGSVVVLGDLHLHDAAAISRVQHGTRGLSLGYTYRLAEGDTPGSFSQRDLRCNHIAICRRGRMGTEIVDAENGERRMTTEERASIDSMFSRIITVLDKLVAKQAQSETEDADLITAVTPKSAASLPGKGSKPETFGKLTSAEKTTTPQHPISTKLSTSAGAGGPAEVDGEEDDDVIGATAHPNFPDRIVDGLRQLRPIIIASRDNSKIATFNTAMRLAKAGNPEPAARLLVAHDRARTDDLRGHFSDSVAAARARLLGEKEAEPALTGGNHAAQDAERLTKSFEEQIRDRRMRLLAGGR